MAFCSNCGKELPAGASFCPSCGATVSGTTPTPQYRSGIDALAKDHRAQDFWLRRLIAYVIDVIAVGIVTGIVVLASSFSSIFVYPFTWNSFFSFFSTAIGVSGILSGIILVLYFSVAESTYGQSLGKAVMRLKVVMDAGVKPSFSSALIRNASKIHWILLLLDVIVGLATSSDYSRKFSDTYVHASVVPQ